MPVDGRIFLKSEYAPIGDHWPTVSFTKLSVGERLKQRFNPRRDVLIYVGTKNPKSTGDRSHRQRLLSAIKIDPSEIVKTSSEVPQAIWKDTVNKYGNRWVWSLRVIGAWNFKGFPSARDIVPASYRLLGVKKNMGNVVEILEGDRTALLQLNLEPVVLSNRRFETGFSIAMNDDVAISREIWRMAAIVRERVRISGTQTTKTNPLRRMEFDFYEVLSNKWNQQSGLCALCRGRLITATANKLLRASADRVDSHSAWYDDKNAQITHLGCNLAKNDASTDEFEEWLVVVKGVRILKRATAGQS